ncbi:MAG: zinc-ribbon domain-containing protein [Candidatus Eisenbacteria bacterium]
MFFLIVGIRPRRRPVPSPVRRVHACPGCGQRRLFEEVRVVPYFDLFFIPLFPVGSGSRVLRCSHCRLEVPTTGVFTKAWDAEEVAPESVPSGSPESATGGSPVRAAAVAPRRRSRSTAFTVVGDSESGPTTVCNACTVRSVKADFEIGL